MSKTLGVSYPTVRKRLNELIAQLEAEIKRDEEIRKKLLDDISRGKLSADDGVEKLKKS